MQSLRPATLLKTETLAQVFSWEFCEIEISKNTFLHRTPMVAASVPRNLCFFQLKQQLHF